jgi:hypothetical protein
VLPEREAISSPTLSTLLLINNGCHYERMVCCLSAKQSYRPHYLPYYLSATGLLQLLLPITLPLFRNDMMVSWNMA